MEYVIGDIHGRINALREILNYAKFDYQNDTLILLGDIADGGYYTYDVIEELYHIKNCIFIKGNHDEWFINHICQGFTPSYWLNQGGANTLNSYGGDVTPNTNIEQPPIYCDIKGVRFPVHHLEFLSTAQLYHVQNNMLFVHGGIDPTVAIEEQHKDVLLWDRDIIRYVENGNIAEYDYIFIGHTPTQMIRRDIINFKCRHCGHESSQEVDETVDIQNKNPDCSICGAANPFKSIGATAPVQIGNVICMDTGAGWDGRLTMMNINTGQIFQSQLQQPDIP